MRKLKSRLGNTGTFCGHKARARRFEKGGGRQGGVGLCVHEWIIYNDGVLELRKAQITCENRPQAKGLFINIFIPDEIGECEKNYEQSFI